MNTETTISVYEYVAYKVKSMDVTRACRYILAEDPVDVAEENIKIESSSNIEDIIFVVFAREGLPAFSKDRVFINVSSENPVLEIKSRTNVHYFNEKSGKRSQIRIYSEDIIVAVKRWIAYRQSRISYSDEFNINAHSNRMPEEQLVAKIAKRESKRLTDYRYLDLDEILELDRMKDRDNMNYQLHTTILEGKKYSIFTIGDMVDSKGRLFVYTGLRNYDSPAPPHIFYKVDMGEDFAIVTPKDEDEENAKDDTYLDSLDFHWSEEDENITQQDPHLEQTQEEDTSQL